MIFDDTEGFYFDRIHIISWCSISALDDQLPLDQMRKECKSLITVELNEPYDQPEPSVKDKSSEKKPYSGYKSKIEVIAPNAKFLRLLSENEEALGRAYKISYLEIAHDVFCESAGDAELKADILFDDLRKKYSFGRIYEKLNKTKEEMIKDRIRGLFASRAFYSSFEKEKEKKEKKKKGKKGKKRNRFIYVIYARHSKMNNRYCTHREWRITGSDMIRKKVHIMNVKDLCSFDIEDYFRKKENQYLVKEKINHLALGKWLKGYDGRRKLDEKMQQRLEFRAIQYMGLRIDTYSDLVLHFKSEKEQIKKKRGVRSEWERRLMSLKSYERFRDVQ